MQAENLYAVTGFMKCALPVVGGQWLGKTSPRPTPTHLLAARAPVHEDGGRDHDAPHVLHGRSDGGNSETRTDERKRGLFTCESQRDTQTC